MAKGEDLRELNCVSLILLIVLVNFYTVVMKEIQSSHVRILLEEVYLWKIKSEEINRKIFLLYFRHVIVYSIVLYSILYY